MPTLVAFEVVESKSEGKIFDKVRTKLALPIIVESTLKKNDLAILVELERRNGVLGEARYRKLQIFDNQRPANSNGKANCNGSRTRPRDGWFECY